MDQVFQQYQVSCYGFLPQKCVKQLPPNFSQYDTLVKNLSSANFEMFRELVNSLPTYSPELYSLQGLSFGEKQYLYSLLTMSMQKYIWGDGFTTIQRVIPQEIGIPLFEIAEELGLRPALTYAGSILYNWTLKDESLPISLENLQVIHRLIDDTPFEWFCLIHAAIEAEAGELMIPIYNIHSQIKENNVQAIKDTLRKVIKSIQGCEVILKRMYERCPPEDFWRFRFFFEGTTDTNFFPDGLVIKGSKQDNKIVVRGASGGQSSLMQIFDALFQVDHIGHGNHFLEEMRSYMPKAHQQFLQDFTKKNILKTFTEQSNDEELRDLFIDTVDTFTTYRKSHLKLVHDYIFKMLKPDVEMSPKKTTEKTLYKENKTGTGGTDAPTFLKQTIQETRMAKANLTKNKMKSDGEEKFGIEKEERVQVKLSVKFERTMLRDLLISILVGFVGITLTKHLLEYSY